MADDGRSAQPHHRRAHKIGPAIRRFVRYQIRAARKRRTEKQKENPQDRAARRTATATVVIAVFTLVLAGLGGYQGYIISGQLDEMKEQRLVTEAQVRANLRLDTPRVDPMTDDGKIAAAGVEVHSFAFTPRWTNTGSLTATDFIAWFHIKFFDRTNHLDRLIQPSDCAPTPRPAEAALPGALGVVSPQEDKMELAQSVGVADVLKVQSGGGFILMWGHVEYRDGFSDTPLRHHDWCVLVVPNNAAAGQWSFPIIWENAN